MSSVLACGATTTVQPKVGHDITYVKYQEVQITGDADLILGGTADFVIDVQPRGINTSNIGTRII